MKLTKCLPKTVVIILNFFFFLQGYPAGGIPVEALLKFLNDAKSGFSSSLEIKNLTVKFDRKEQQSVFQKHWQKEFLFTAIHPVVPSTVSALSPLFTFQDLLTLVLLEIDAVELIYLRAVCRRWRDLIPTLHASAVLLEATPTKAFSALVTVFPKLQSLSMIQVSHHDRLPFQHLTALAYRSSPPLAQSFWQSLTSLRSLCGVALSREPIHVTGLTRLEMVEAVEEDIIDFSLLSSLTNLITLKFVCTCSFHPSWKVTNLRSLLLRLTKLRNLDLGNLSCRLLDEDNELLTALTNLRSVSLFFGSEKISSPMRQLRSLVGYGETKCKVSSEQFPNLESLRFFVRSSAHLTIRSSSITQLELLESAQGFRHVIDAPNVRVFSVEGALDMNLGTFSKLERLSLLRLSNYTHTFDSLVKSLTSLRILCESVQEPLKVRNRFSSF